MRTLIDECTPSALTRFLTQHGHECRTAQEMGWSGKKNGELLDLAENEFEALITLDTNLRYQQNLRGRKIAVGARSRSSFSELRRTVWPTSAAISQPAPRHSR